jgi:hypothetical protein
VPGRRFTIFTSPIGTGKSPNPTLLKSNGHYFILFYEEENEAWNGVLTAVAKMFKQ